MKITIEEKNLYLTNVFSPTYIEWINNDPLVQSRKEVFFMTDFVPSEAVSYGILGLRKPTVTRSGIEVIACCNALNGWG